MFLLSLGYFAENSLANGTSLEILDMHKMCLVIICLKHQPQREPNIKGKYSCTTFWLIRILYAPIRKQQLCLRAYSICTVDSNSFQVERIAMRNLKKPKERLVYNKIETNRNGIYEHQIWRAHDMVYR